MKIIDKIVQDWSREIPELDGKSLRLVGKLAFFQRRLDERLSSKLEEIGLSLTNFEILSSLRRMGEPYTLLDTELSTRVSLTAGTMRSALMRLQNSGLVTRDASVADGRSAPVKLTSKGKRIVERAINIRVNEAREVTNLLKREDAELLSGVLDRWHSELHRLEK